MCFYIKRKCIILFKQTKMSYSPSIDFKYRNEEIECDQEDCENTRRLCRMIHKPILGTHMFYCCEECAELGDTQHRAAIRRSYREMAMAREMANQTEQKTA